jgi:GR25 family glycosyltransferase involved in LPS biosynthesis
MKVPKFWLWLLIFGLVISGVIVTWMIFVKNSTLVRRNMSAVMPVVFVISSEKFASTIQFGHNLVQYVQGNKDLRVVTSESRRLRTRANLEALTNEEYAIADAHKRVYEKIIQSGVRGALIIEDGTQFIPHFKERLLNFMPDLPEKWDVINLALGERNQTVASEHDQHVCILGENSCNAAYLVSAEGARKLLHATTQILFPMKSLLKQKTLEYTGITEFRTFLVDPAMAIVSPSP